MQAVLGFVPNILPRKDETRWRNRGRRFGAGRESASSVRSALLISQVKLNVYDSACKVCARRRARQQASDEQAGKYRFVRRISTDKRACIDWSGHVLGGR